MSIDDSMQSSTNDGAAVIREPEEDTETEDGAAADGVEFSSRSGDEKPAGPAPGREPGTGKFQAQGKSRKDRRSAFQAAGQQIEERVSQRVAEQMKEYQRNFEQIVSRAMQDRGAAAPVAAQADRGDAEMERLQLALGAEIAAAQNHDRSKGNYDYSRYQKIQAEIQRLGTERHTLGVLQRIGITPELLRSMRNPQQGREAYGREAQYTARFYTLKTEFPWLSDENHSKAVGAYRKYLIATGSGDSIETDREAAAHIAATRGLNGRSVPRGQPGRYAGMRGGEGGGERQPREVRLPAGALRGLSPDEQKLVQQAVFTADS